MSSGRAVGVTDDGRQDTAPEDLVKAEFFYVSYGDTELESLVELGLKHQRIKSNLGSWR